MAKLHKYCKIENGVKKYFYSEKSFNEWLSDYNNGHGQEHKPGHKPGQEHHEHQPEPKKPKKRGTRARLICKEFYPFIDSAHAKIKDGCFEIDIDGITHEVYGIKRRSPKKLEEFFNVFFSLAHPQIPAGCEYNESQRRFEFYSETIGSSSTISLLRPGTKGTDVSGLGTGRINGADGIVINGSNTSTPGRLICGTFNVHPDVTQIRKGCFKLSIDGLEYEIMDVDEKSYKEGTKIARVINKNMETARVPAGCEYNKDQRRFEFYTHSNGSKSKISMLKGSHGQDMSGDDLGGLNGMQNGISINGEDAD